MFQVVRLTWAIFEDAHVRGIEEMMESKSDRVTAIVGGALLDNTLRRTLAERLQKNKDIAGKLLKVGGALGNTEPKVDVLYMLGAFDKPVRNALYGLVKVRNFYAHNLDASFDSQHKDMQEAMRQLTLHDGRTFYPHHIYEGDSDYSFGPITNNLDKFIVNLQLCLIFLMRDRASHETWSNKPLTKKALRELREDWKRRERSAREQKQT